ncbi:MAG: sulfatase family protein [Planctomycetota bacterium]|jgi:arylsulfatase A-like enzyme
MSFARKSMERPYHHCNLNRVGPAALILLSILCLLVMAGCKKSDSHKPNLVLITVDTLRADRLHCYACPLPISPTVDALAKRGLRFETCYAHSSATIPSMSSMMAGLYPSEVGARSVATPMLGDVDTISLALKRKGYRTAAFVSNYNLRPKMHFNLGFDHYDSNFTKPELNRPHILTRDADETTDAVLKWMGTVAMDRTKPFFLWIHYQDPHGPYTPPKDFIPEESHYPRETLNKSPGNFDPNGIPQYQQLESKTESAFYRARYDGEILFFDHHLSRIMQALDRLEFSADTAIVLSADHGESMGEHDFWFIHGQDLYNELIRVPLIIAAPWIEAGEPKEAAALMDIFPTFMALTGADSDELSQYRGVNLLDPEARRKVRPIFSEIRSAARRMKLRSVILGRWKLIVTARKDDMPQLFDLEKDPGEKNNLYTQEPEVAERMIKILKAEQQRAESGKAAQEIPLSPEELKILEALGYTGD